MRTRTKIISGVVAAIAAAGALSLTPLASASSTASGGDCYGSEVIRCVTTGSAYGYTWAWGSVKDADGGTNYSVSVSNATIERSIDGEWVHLAHSNDYDGWWGVREEAETQNYRCYGRSVRAKVLVKWKRVGSTHVSKEWLYGPALRCAS
ncbi:MAG: hypothetical protein ACRDUA_00355 [Micromonosporaceae bacterium]